MSITNIRDLSVITLVIDRTGLKAQHIQSTLSHLTVQATSSRLEAVFKDPKPQTSDLTPCSCFTSSLDQTRSERENETARRGTRNRE